MTAPDWLVCPNCQEHRNGLVFWPQEIDGECSNCGHIWSLDHVRRQAILKFVLARLEEEEV